MSAPKAIDRTDAVKLADQLRSAAAWLTLAAEQLEEGRCAKAANMARLGLLTAQDAPRRITALDHPD